MRFRTTVAAAVAAAGFAVLALAGSASTSSLPAGFIDTLLATGLDSPTAMAFGPNNRVLVTEQGGDLRVTADANLNPTPFVHLSVDSDGERGLLGVAYDPSFSSNRFVYVYYTVPGVARPQPGQPVHRRRERPPGGRRQRDSDLRHRFARRRDQPQRRGDPFGQDGKLYVAVGDNADGTNSQSLTTLKGKILRINKDGTIPTDNPFYNQATGDNRAIWALGLRNPFTFAFQPGTGRLFINDVGETTYEEIDDGLAGCELRLAGLRRPVQPAGPRAYGSALLLRA